jgi:aerobic-type carbon monoxide dehydrogenase small subunit (CoxS/CutS family)
MTDGPRTDGTASMWITLDVNGAECSVEVTADDTLVDVLRGELNLTSCRETCGLGLCGSCTVVVDGHAVSACLAPAFQADGAIVRTAEGLQRGAEPSRLQRAFVEEQAFQCSFCTPGFLMSATALLEEEGSRSVEDALSGHVCRCGSYDQIVRAVERTVAGSD